jgi:hypothetical protein
MRRVVILIPLARRVNTKQIHPPRPPIVVAVIAVPGNIQIPMMRRVVKLAMVGRPPTPLKLDVPDVLQVNTTAMEVVKIVKVVNTKMNWIKTVVNLIAMPVFPSILLKRPVPNAALANTKIKPMQRVAKLAG